MPTTPAIPTLTLNNGVTMPQLGFGVFQVPPDEVIEPVAAPIEAGYRLIDTAAAYGNEDGVGKTIANSGSLEMSCSSQRSSGTRTTATTAR